MSDRDLPLTPEQERQLDSGLGLTDQELDANALAIREVVRRVRAAEQPKAVDPKRISAVVAAARAASQAPEIEVPSLWTVLQGRLQNSVLMRVVAASLVVHLAALPVLAWLHFVTPKREPFFIHFEPPPPVLTSEPQPEMLEPIVVPHFGSENVEEIEGQEDPSLLDNE